MTGPPQPFEGRGGLWSRNGPGRWNLPGEPGTPAIDALFTEDRRYPPPPGFASQANAQPDIYERDPDEFWETEGRTRVTWSVPFDTLVEWNLPYAKWYLGGKLNEVNNPAETELGYVTAPGGRAVLYANGHVVWKKE